MRDPEETLEYHRQWMYEKVTTIHNRLRPFLEDAQRTANEQQLEDLDTEPAGDGIGSETPVP